MLELFDVQSLRMSTNKIILQFYACGAVVCLLMYLLTMSVGSHYYSGRHTTLTSPFHRHSPSESGIIGDTDFSLHRPHSDVTDTNSDNGKGGEHARKSVSSKMTLAESVSQNKDKSHSSHSSHSAVGTKTRAGIKDSAAYGVKSEPSPKDHGESDKLGVLSENKIQTHKTAETQANSNRLPPDQTGNQSETQTSDSILKDSNRVEISENVSTEAGSHGASLIDGGAKRREPLSELEDTSPCVGKVGCVDHGSTTINTTNITQHGGKKLLCHDLYGRLGNLLFQYAGVLGIAYETNRIAVIRIPPGRPHQIRLDSVLKHSSQYPPHIQRAYEERCNKTFWSTNEGGKCCTFSKNVSRFDPEHDYHIGGYLQSWKYWRNQETRVRKMIEFNDDIQTNASAIITDIRQKFNGSTLVGFHLRLNDIQLKFNVELGYKLPTSRYINASLEYFSRKFPDPVFVVASDSISWCQKNLPRQYKFHFLKSNPAPVDLWVLASLDHLIATFGTFSWWAGYLNKGTVVYMDDFIVPGTYIGSQITREDFIPPGWIPL